MDPPTDPARAVMKTRIFYRVETRRGRQMTGDAPAATATTEIQAGTGFQGNSAGGGTPDTCGGTGPKPSSKTGIELTCRRTCCSGEEGEEGKEEEAEPRGWGGGG